MQPEQGKLDFNKRLDSPIKSENDSAYKMTYEEKKVWEIIQTHRVRENAVVGPTISAMTEIEYDRVRAVIAHLITEHGCLIASGAYGYFVPGTAEEVSAATRSLRHRGIMILVRAAKLQKISLEDVFHQGKLEFKEALSAL